MPNYEKFNEHVRPPINDSLMTRESWKIFQIMAEFVEGFERLARIKPSVSVFGSARTPPDHPWYQLAEAISRAISYAVFCLKKKTKMSEKSSIND